MNQDNIKGDRINEIKQNLNAKGFEFKPKVNDEKDESTEEQQRGPVTIKKKPAFLDELKQKMAEKKKDN